MKRNSVLKSLKKQTITGYIVLDENNRTVAHFNRQIESCVNLIKVDLSPSKYPQDSYINFEKKSKSTVNIFLFKF